MSICCYCALLKINEPSVLSVGKVKKRETCGHLLFCSVLTSMYTIAKAWDLSAYYITCLRVFSQGDTALCKFSLFLDLIQLNKLQIQVNL